MPITGRQTSFVADKFGPGRHAVFEVVSRAPRLTVLQSIRFDARQHSQREVMQWLDGEGRRAVLLEFSTGEGKENQYSRDEIAMRDGCNPNFTTRGFMLRQDSINTEKRTVEAIIATEAPAMVRDFHTFEVIDEVIIVKGMHAVDDSIPLLDSHNRFTVTAQLGSTRRFRVEKESIGDVLVARNMFGKTQRAMDAFSLVEEGHLRSFSVGYSVRVHVDLKPGESQTVAGRKFTAGQRLLRISLSTDLKENSLVTIGADRNAKVRAA